MQFNGFKFFVESVGLVSVYIDSCAWNRHTDDKTQDRVRREASALDQIIGLIMHGDVRLVYSQALQEEMIRNSQLAKEASRLAKHFIQRTPEIDQRGNQLHTKAKLGPYDALHVASAEAAGADFLLTTDDRMIKKANQAGVHVRLMNPVDWLKSSGFQKRASALKALVAS
jgi:predicted nucleic acid-binding protein